MKYMELYGILQLSPTTIIQLQQTNQSPFIYSQMYRDILSRNYHILRKYSKNKNYCGVSYKLFLSRVKNQAYQQRKVLKRKVNKENQHVQFKNRGNSGNNGDNGHHGNSRKLKTLMSSQRYRMRMTMKSQTNNTTIWKRISLKIPQNIIPYRPKLPTPKQKQLNVVWLGQQELLNNQKAQKYLNRWQNILLVRLNKKKSRIPELLNRKQMSMQENISVQINNYNIKKFMSASGGVQNRGYLQYFNA